MRGKQSSKISLKKRLLKRRQALTRRWNKQSTRRHLLVYLLCNLLLVGGLYGCIFAIPNVRDVRTVRTKITDVHYEAVPGICENSVRAKKALDWIGGMSRDGACVASLCSHDPDVAPQTIEF